jgi:hypothetical protein
MSPFWPVAHIGAILRRVKRSEDAAVYAKPPVSVDDDADL